MSILGSFNSLSARGVGWGVGNDGTPRAAYIYTESNMVVSNGFGISAAISGDGSTFSVGQVDTPSGTDRGSIYERTGYNYTSGVITNRILGPTTGLSYGFNIAYNYDGNYRAVSYIQNPLPGTAPYSRIQIYNRALNNTQIITSTDANYAYIGLEPFKQSLTLNYDGSVMIAGSSRTTSTSITSSAAAFIYTRSGNTWTETAKLPALAINPTLFQDPWVDINDAGDTFVISVDTAQVLGVNNFGSVEFWRQTAGVWGWWYTPPLTGKVAAPISGCWVSGDGNTFVVTSAIQTSPSNRFGTWVYKWDGASWSETIFTDFVAAGFSKNSQVIVGVAFPSSGFTYTVLNYNGSSWVSRNITYTVPAIYWRAQGITYDGQYLIAANGSGGQDYPGYLYYLG